MLIFPADPKTATVGTLSGLEVHLTPSVLNPSHSPRTQAPLPNVIQVASNPVPIRVLVSLWNLMSQGSTVCISLCRLAFQTPIPNRIAQ